MAHRLAVGYRSPRRPTRRRRLRRRRARPASAWKSASAIRGERRAVDLVVAARLQRQQCRAQRGSGTARSRRRGCAGRPASSNVGEHASAPSRLVPDMMPTKSSVMAARRRRATRPGCRLRARRRAVRDAPRCATARPAPSVARSSSICRSNVSGHRAERHLLGAARSAAPRAAPRSAGRSRGRRCGIRSAGAGRWPSPSCRRSRSGCPARCAGRAASRRRTATGGRTASSTRPGGGSTTTLP